jgi:hypothetical protein
MTFVQLSVFMENKLGMLVDALEVLSEAGINMRALALAYTADYGILRIIVDKPVQAHDALNAAGFLVKLNEVVAIEITHKPGAYAAIMRILADAGINVEYTYAFVAHGRDSAHVIIRVNNNNIAIKVLTDNGVKLLSDGDIC